MRFQNEVEPRSALRYTVWEQEGYCGAREYIREFSRNGEGRDEKSSCGVKDMHGGGEKKGKPRGVGKEGRDGGSFIRVKLAV